MLNSFIGNEKAANLLRIGIKAAIRKNDKLPDYLFSGAAGNGKTKMARDIIKEIDGVSTYINAGTLSSTESIVSNIDSLFCKYNERKARYAVAIIDEAHSLRSGKICDFFLTAISENTLETRCGRGTESFPIKRKQTGKNDFFSWIFITNRAGELADALISRLCEVRFLDYTLDERVEISRNYLESIDAEFHEEICHEIAKRAWSAREIIKYSNGLNDYFIYKNLDHEICKRDADEYFELIGIDKRGLGAAERDYLRILSESARGISLVNIAAKMGVSSGDVSNMIERKLIKLGLVNIESNGRSLSNTEELANRFSV